MNEIKDCPFCGCRAKTKVIDRRTPPYGCLIVCQCLNCQAQVGPIEYDDEHLEESEEKIIQKWNNRYETEDLK